MCTYILSFRVRVRVRVRVMCMYVYMCTYILSFRVRVRVRVSSFVLSWCTERESNRSTHDSGSNGLPL